jgi:hypothetical protein
MYGLLLMIMMSKSVYPYSVLRTSVEGLEFIVVIDIRA